MAYDKIKYFSKKTRPVDQVVIKLLVCKGEEGDEECLGCPHSVAHTKIYYKVIGPCTDLALCGTLAKKVRCATV